MLNARKRFYAITTLAAMRRQANALLLLFAFVGIAIGSHPEIIGAPISNLAVHPANIVSNTIFLTLYLVACFAWICWQKEAVCGGSFAYYARSLPVESAVWTRLNRRLLSNALLPLLIVPLVALGTIKSAQLSLEPMAFFCIALISAVAFIWRLGSLVLLDREAAAVWVFVGGILLAVAASAAPLSRLGLGLLAVAIGHLSITPRQATIRQSAQKGENGRWLQRGPWLAFFALAWARAWHGYREALVARWLTGCLVLGIAWYAAVQYDMGDRYWGFSATACGVVGWLLTGLYLAEVKGDAAMRYFVRTLPRGITRSGIAEVALVMALMLAPLVCYIAAMHNAGLLVAPQRIFALFSALPLLAFARVIRCLPENWDVMAQGGIWAVWSLSMALLF